MVTPDTDRFSGLLINKQVTRWVGSRQIDMRARGTQKTRTEATCSHKTKTQAHGQQTNHKSCAKQDMNTQLMRKFLKKPRGGLSQGGSRSPGILAGSQGGAGGMDQGGSGRTETLEDGQDGTGGTNQGGSSLTRTLEDDQGGAGGTD